jgi:hypothetical protein
MYIHTHRCATLLRAAVIAAALAWLAPNSFALASGSMAGAAQDGQSEKEKDAKNPKAQDRQRQKTPPGHPGTAKPAQTKDSAAPNNRYTPPGDPGAGKPAQTKETGDSYDPYGPGKPKVDPRQQPKESSGQYVPDGRPKDARTAPGAPQPYMHGADYVEEGGTGMPAPRPKDARTAPGSPQPYTHGADYVEEGETGTPASRPVSYKPAEGGSYSAADGAYRPPMSAAEECPAPGSPEAEAMNNGYSPMPGGGGGAGGRAPMRGGRADYGSASAPGGRPDQRVREITSLRPERIKGKFPQELLRYANRPAIPFVPIPMIDPNTGREVGPDFPIKLPNGKVQAAGPYYQDLNRFEQFLNQHGYSLRQGEDSEKVKLAELDNNPALLRRQMERTPRPTRMPYRDFNAKFSEIAKPAIFHIGPEEMAQLQRKSSVPPAQVASAVKQVNQSCVQVYKSGSGGIINPQAFGPLSKFFAKLKPNVGPFGVNTCQPVNKIQGLPSFDLGQQSTFEAYMHGNLSLTGQVCEPPDLSQFNVNNQSHLEAALDQSAGGYIMGMGGDILKVHGSAIGDGPSNTESVDFHAYMLGNDTFDFSATGNYNSTHSPLSYSHTWDIYNVDKSEDEIIMVGYIPVDLAIGFKADADVNLTVNVYPTSVSAIATPHTKASVYAEAGVTLYLVEAGVGVEMVLLEAKVPLSGTVGVGFRPGVGWVLDNDLTASADLNFLSGDIYLFAKVHYPCWIRHHGPGMCEREYDYSLWDWPGMNQNNLLFDNDTSASLDW